MPHDRIFFVLPLSWFYKEGRARPLGKAFSRFWATWARLGLPPRRQAALEVVGRATGRRLSSAVVIARHNGDEYLVSMMGEGEWVRNVRASGGSAWIVARKRRLVHLEEVPVEERAPIIMEFLRLAPGARPHIGLDAGATTADCAAVAHRHPVYRIGYRGSEDAG